jgi:hypothetical protein
LLIEEQDMVQKPNMPISLHVGKHKKLFNPQENPPNLDTASGHEKKLTLQLNQ